MATLVLKPAPPFRLDLTVWVLRRLPVNAMDRWDGRRYRRLFAIRGAPLDVTVEQIGAAAAPQLQITPDRGRLAKNMKADLAVILGKVLGLSVDLTPFFRLAASDEMLAEFAPGFRGFRPPRLPSVFEALINGIACQQLSLTVGLYLLNRLCATYGLSAGGHFAFPSPEGLARAKIEKLRSLGFSRRKAETIIDISRAVAGGRLDLDSLEALDDASGIARLREIKGVGRWTAEYVMLRGLGRLNVFPADDVGGQKRLQAWLKMRDQPDYESAYRILERWAPYRGLLYFFLLLNDQKRKGYFDGPNAGIGVLP